MARQPQKRGIRRTLKPAKIRREQPGSDSNMFQKALLFLMLVGGFAYLFTGSEEQGAQAPVIPAVVNQQTATSALKPEIKQLKVEYLGNSASGRRALITGNIYNASGKPLAKVQLQADMLRNRQLIRQVEVYAGRNITRANLQTWSTARISDYLNKPYHDDSSRLIVLEPGGSLPFMVVFGNVQDENRDYQIDVIHWQEN